MKESFEAQREYFKYPDIEAERGEFERVGQTFGVDSDTLMFLAKEEGEFISLNDSLWGILENTDSYKFGKGDWSAVAKFSNEYARDWESLRSKIEHGGPLDAPIILKMNGIYHLISGNTRLMVARALGITPKVLVFEYTHHRINE
jgi:hypothetical protein